MSLLIFVNSCSFVPESAVCLQELRSVDGAEPGVRRHALRCKIIDLLVKSAEYTEVGPRIAIALLKTR